MSRPRENESVVKLPCSRMFNIHRIRIEYCHDNSNMYIPGGWYHINEIYACV